MISSIPYVINQLSPPISSPVTHRRLHWKAGLIHIKTDSGISFLKTSLRSSHQRFQESHVSAESPPEKSTPGSWLFIQKQFLGILFKMLSFPSDLLLVFSDSSSCQHCFSNPMTSSNKFLKKISAIPSSLQGTLFSITIHKILYQSNPPLVHI